MNRFDHENLHVFPAAIDFVVLADDVDPDGASCRGVGRGQGLGLGLGVKSNLWARELSSFLFGRSVSCKDY